MTVKTKNQMLRYCLNDMLEMNFSSDPKVLKHVERTLLSKPVNDSNLHLSTSFVLDDMLVVIQKSRSKKIGRLYVLDARRESFESLSVGRSRLNGTPRS